MVGGEADPQMGRAHGCGLQYLVWNIEYVTLLEYSILVTI